jgi:hypothetical protein
MTALGPRGLTMLVPILAMGIVTFSAEAQQMRDTEQRLLRDLERTASFRALVPARREITRLEFAGSVLPGDLVYGAEPAEIAIAPRVLSATLARNCASGETRAVQGTMSGAFTDSMSLTTTHGWEIGGSVQFRAGWPAAETTWTVNASYSGSVARATDESETWSVSQGGSSPVLPRTEFDVQLQVIQQWPGAATSPMAGMSTRSGRSRCWSPMRARWHGNVTRAAAPMPSTAWSPGRNGAMTSMRAGSMCAVPSIAAGRIPASS